MTGSRVSCPNQYKSCAHRRAHRLEPRMRTINLLVGARFETPIVSALGRWLVCSMAKFTKLRMASTDVDAVRSGPSERPSVLGVWISSSTMKGRWQGPQKLRPLRRPTYPTLSEVSGVLQLGPPHEEYGRPTWCFWARQCRWLSLDGTCRSTSDHTKVYTGLGR
jgi:hypothetical protein